MSVQEFKQLVAASKLKKNDKTWFPRWVQRYSISVSNRHGLLPVTVDTVIQFSRSLRDNSTPAWQRLQAVRAVEAYRDLVLQQSKPALNEIRVKLSRLAAKEKAEGRGITSRPDTTDQRQLIGVIDPSEPQVIRELRTEMRLRRMALATERAYAGWVYRFSEVFRTADLRSLDEQQIRNR